MTNTKAGSGPHARTVAVSTVLYPHNPSRVPYPSPARNTPLPAPRPAVPHGRHPSRGYISLISGHRKLDARITHTRLI